MRNASSNLVSSLVCVALGCCGVGLTACSKAPSPEKSAAGARNEKGVSSKETDEQRRLMKRAALGPLPVGPVAKIGEDEISLETFRQIYDLKLKKYDHKGRDMTARIDTRYRRTVTERLIRQELLAREAKALAVGYDEKELDVLEEEMRRRARSWKEDLQRRGETDGTLREVKIANLLETAILKTQVDLGVTQKEIDEEYERIKTNFDKDTDRYRILRLVFESEEYGDAAKAKAKAEEVKALAAAEGVDFLVIGRERSRSLLSGDMGLRRADRLEPHFSEMMATLEPGQISEPRQIDQGYEIVKFVARWGPGVLPLEALADQIESSLAGRKRQEEGKKLMERLYTKYKVDNLMLATLER